MIAPVHKGGSPKTSRALGGCAVAALVASVAACGTDGLPPVPLPPTRPGEVAGRVMDWTVPSAPRPVPNLRLLVRAKGPTDGAVGGEDLPEVVSDQNGRYAITEATQRFVFLRTAPDAAYRFLCPFHPLPVESRWPIDLPVVHVSWSGDTPVGPFNQVFGVVSERVAGQMRPVTGATVMFESGLQDPPSATSDSGFYALCSIVGADQTRTVTASKDGYRTVSRDFIQWSTSTVPVRIDLEMARD